MRKLTIIAAIVALSGCVAGLPQDKCGEGYVLHTSPAGNERCIKPGMAVGDGVIEAGILIGGGVALANAGIPNLF